MNFKLRFSIVASVVMALFFSSCSKTESYSDLLKKEQKASNWFLAQHKVCNEIPADSVFVEGVDAPYYKMDPDGYVYMQVISSRPRKERDIPAYGSQVYFTYMRYDIEAMYSANSLDIPGTGNQDNFINPFGNTYFLFNNYSVNTSATYGSGIQIPVSFLGYNCEVNLLLKSYYGFASDNTTCIPYKVNLRYFKAEY